MYTLDPAALSALRGQVPEDRLTQDPQDLREYGRDWTRAHEPAPSIVALPRSTEEVARLLGVCHEHGVPVVPSGGRTGLAAGAVAARGELVLSLSRLNQLGPVDELGQTVRVGAGAVTQAVHQHCEERGLTWPIDLAAKGQCQVGGNIATNAGGVKVIRYGLTRQWVLGLQVVTAAGEVLELNGALEKNNTGADLRQLFIGSEGTLGVITAATLKLARVPRGLSVFLFAVPDLAGVLALFQEARRGPFTIAAYEFMERRCVDLVCRHRGARDPFPGFSGCYVLMEVEAPGASDADDGRGGLEAWLSEQLEAGRIHDGVLSQSAAQAQELWALREGISESLSREGVPHKNDVALPIAALSAFCADLAGFFPGRYPGFDIYLFGHIGDGNLHINVLKPGDLPRDEFLLRARDVDRDLFELLRRHRGSISAEHGIGLLKKPYLHYSRTPAELSILRGLKRALDPRGILNPGKLLDV